MVTQASPNNTIKHITALMRQSVGIFILCLGFLTACSNTEDESIAPLSVAPNEIAILSQFSGTIEALFVQQGQEVQQGYPLFSLSNEKHRALYTASLHQLAELESLIPPERLAHIHPRAKKAPDSQQLPHDLTPLGAQHAAAIRQEKQAKERIETLSVELAKASLNAHKARTQREKDLINATDLQKNIDALEKTQQELTSAKKNFESLSLTRANIERHIKNFIKPQTATTPDATIQARVEAYEKQLERTYEAQKMLEETTVTSPVKGIILNVNVTEGEEIEQGATALTITVE